jgi:hypothetical protein
MLESQKKQSIKLAKDLYTSEMSKILEFADQTAANKRYINEKIELKTQPDLEDSKHYASIKTYENLLKSIRDTGKIT